MKRPLTLVCWSLLAFAPALLRAGDLVWSTTHIEKTAAFDAESADFVFHFRNAGTHEVTVTDIEPSCGCTTATLDKKTYAPGEEGDLKATMTIDEHTGKLEKFILVQSSDAPNTSTRLEVAVTVPAAYTIEPRLLAWGRGGNGEREQTVVISAAPGYQLTIPEVKGDLPNFHFQLLTDEPGHRYRLIVTPETIDQTMRSALRLKLDFGNGKTRDSSIYCIIRTSPRSM